MFTPQQIKKLNEVEMEMYHFSMNNKELVPYLTIREFASKVYSSPTSVLRFCKKIGCEGFSEFKVFFKQMLENEQSVVSYSDDKDGLFQDFLTKVETPHFAKKIRTGVSLLKSGGGIHCVGAGPTGSIALYASTHLSAVGYFATYIDEYYMNTATHLPSDIYLLFCVSGEDIDLIKFAKKVKKYNGKILLISNSNYSSLSEMSDVVIAYNLYYAKSLQKTPVTFSGHENMDYVVDSFSTQLPVVYLIETLAKSLSND